MIWNNGNKYYDGVGGVTIVEMTYETASNGMKIIVCSRWRIGTQISCVLVTSGLTFLSREPIQL